MKLIISFLQALAAKILFFIYRLAGLRLGSYLGGVLGRLAGKTTPEGARGQQFEPSHAAPLQGPTKTSSDRLL